MYIKSKREKLVSPPNGISGKLRDLKITAPPKNLKLDVFILSKINISVISSQWFLIPLISIEMRLGNS